VAPSQPRGGIADGVDGWISYLYTWDGIDAVHGASLRVGVTDLLGRTAQTRRPRMETITEPRLLEWLAGYPATTTLEGLAILGDTLTEEAEDPENDNWDAVVEWEWLTAQYADI
jgi:hypothetical protein